MNTIHSSSLTHYPVAYSKPQVGRSDDNRRSTADAAHRIPGTPVGELDASPSSTELIQAALADAGLSKDNSASLLNHSQTQKAVNAYVQNYNQIAHRRVAEIVSGIDLYA
ncbi:MAG: hypothetical protein ACXV7J_10320 [Methylomonas sp.]